MTDWLLKFGFGGVQEFIAQARKTRDLATGSKLISDLAGSALRKAVARGAKQIMPTTGAAGACPHQLTLKLTGVDADVVNDCGEAMRETVCDGMKDWAATVENGFGLTDLLCDKEFLLWQLKDALECYWVAVPQGSDYAASFRRLQKLFDNRRHTRTFQQLPQLGDGKESWTCFQCGARPAVIEKKRLAALDSRTSGFLSARDRLCGVCLAKRFASKTLFPSGFPSTVELARDRLLRGPLSAEAGLTRKRLTLILDRWDELEKAERENQRIADRPLREDFKKLKGSAGFMDAFNASSPYYAVVAFDGDRMGRWFSGDAAYWRPELVEKDALWQTQDRLGVCLSRFAAALTTAVEDIGGKLVYLGGDDGLVLLPLDALLPFLVALQQQWAVHIADDSELAARIQGMPPTVSCHAAVVHMKTPLQYVLSELWADLEKTKELGERNSFSILAAPRAGGKALMIRKWDEFDRFNAAAALLLGDGELEPLPTRMPHRIIAAVEPFFAADGKCSSHKGVKLAMEVEARRGLKDSGQVDPAALRNWLTLLIDGYDRNKSSLSLREHLVPALQVAAFLARQLREDEK